MKLEPRNLIVPIVAVIVLALTLQQTVAALRASGSWQHVVRKPAARAEDPYTRVDNLFAKSLAPLAADRMRNPFVFVSSRPAPPAGATPRPVKPQVVAPAAPPRPALTSIIWDSDPRATLRYDGKEFSVRANSLFADFSVRSITATEVILDHNGETIVLGLRSKGD